MSRQHTSARRHVLNFRKLYIKGFFNRMISSTARWSGHNSVCQRTTYRNRLSSFLTIPLFSLFSCRKLVTRLVGFPFPDSFLTHSVPTSRRVILITAWYYPNQILTIPLGVTAVTLPQPTSEYGPSQEDSPPTQTTHNKERASSARLNPPNWTAAGEQETPIQSGRRFHEMMQDMRARFSCLRGGMFNCLKTGHCIISSL